MTFGVEFWERERERNFKHTKKPRNDISKGAVLNTQETKEWFSSHPSNSHILYSRLYVKIKTEYNGDSYLKKTEYNGDTVTIVSWYHHAT